MKKQKAPQPLTVNAVVNVASPERPKKNKRMMAFLFALLFLALAALVVVYIVFYNPLSRFERFLDSGRYDYAARVYENGVIGSGYEPAAADAVDAALEDAKQQYYDENTDAAAARETITSLGGIHADFKSAAEAAESWVGEIEHSRTCYNGGLALGEKGDYAGALELLREVSPEDSYYAPAQQSITQYEELYAKQIANTVAAQLDAGNIQDAIATFGEAAGLVSSDAASVKIMEQTGQSVEAAVLERASALAVAGDYASAVDLLELALGVWPDSADLLAAKTEYQKFLPYYVAALTPSATGAGGLSEQQDLTDNKGVAHTGTVFFANVDSPVYNEYAVGGGYSTLRGRFLAAEGTAGNCYLRIYVDGRMVYQGALAADSAALDFNVNVAGGARVRIELEGSGASVLDAAFYI